VSAGAARDLLVSLPREALEQVAASMAEVARSRLELIRRVVQGLPPVEEEEQENGARE
jgi:signal transduction histidine kinase